jgi:hypothetical protein
MRTHALQQLGLTGAAIIGVVRQRGHPRNFRFV